MRSRAQIIYVFISCGTLTLRRRKRNRSQARKLCCNWNVRGYELLETFAPRCRYIAQLFFATACFPWIVSAAEVPATLPSVDQIIARLEEADGVRNAALLGYTATRSYVLVNERFKKRAEIIVRVHYTQPGRKSFEVLSQDGSMLLGDRVIKRVIKAEEDGSQNESRQLSRISTANYRLRLSGAEELRGRECYVLDLVPVSKSPYLVQGRAWIDKNDYAVVRIEGFLAKKPSIWLGSPKIIQDYGKQGEFWLPSTSSSITDVPIFGRTTLDIQTSSYEVRPTLDHTRASP